MIKNIILLGLIWWIN